jgi:hypothetical protein
MALRSKVGPPLGIQTLAQLQQANRRLDRLRRDANRTLAAMREGATLHLHYQNGRPIWRLSSGMIIPSGVAAVVIVSSAVVSVGDSLSPDHPAQTWRYCND